MSGRILRILAPASLIRLITIANARILNIFPDMSLPPSKECDLLSSWWDLIPPTEYMVYYMLSILEAKGQISACHCDSYGKGTYLPP